MKTRGSFIIFSMFYIASLVFSAIGFAAEPQNNFKFTCIPELNYVEITSVFTEFQVSEAIREKYNLKYLQDFDCEFSDGGAVTLKFEMITWANARRDGKYRQGVWYGTGEREGNYRLAVVRGGKEVIAIEDFGTFTFDDGTPNLTQFPQFFTYDGRVARACYGLVTRECKIFQPQE